MKRYLGVITILFFVCSFYVSVSWAGSAPPLPPKGELIVKGSSDFKVLSLKKKEVRFFVPALQEQTQKENLRDPVWQISTSLAWTDGKDWLLVSQRNYTIKTEPKEGGSEAIFSFPEQGMGWYWLRIWGQEKVSKNWLWIDQSSLYCRNDKTGNPGYEILIHPESATHRPVPTTFEIRP